MFCSYEIIRGAISSYNRCVFSNSIRAIINISAKPNILENITIIAYKVEN